MELGEVMGVIRRRWLVFSVTVVGFVALAVGLAVTQSPQYEAVAHVIVGEADVVAAALGEPPAVSSQPDRDLNTQAQIVRIAPFAEKLAEQGVTPAVLAERVAVEPVSDTGLLKITARGGSPEQALRRADAVGATYVAWTQAQARGRLEQAATSTEKRLDDVRKRLDAAAAGTEREAAAAEYTELSARLERLQTAMAMPAEGVRVVAPAALTSPDPVAPRPLKQGALGLALGLVFGLIAAFGMERVRPARMAAPARVAGEHERLVGVPEGYGR